jgi:hypothetical protein
MYTDYFLKFADEAAADAVLFEGEGEERRPLYAAIDVIGTIYEPTGEMLTTDEGEVPEMAPVPGWHVNVRHTEKVAALAKYAVSPKTPQRMWA